MSKKVIASGIMLVCLGIASGLIQKLFYGYIDEKGILHDSIFLPLAFLFLLAGILLISGAVIFFLIKQIGKQRKRKPGQA